MTKFYGEYYQSFINKFVDILRTLYPFYASSMPTPSKSNVNEQSNSTGQLEENQNTELESFLYGDCRIGTYDSTELEKYKA